MTAACFGGIDAAIIDLDGTMVDTLGDFAQALGGMLDDLQLPGVQPEAIALLVGKGSEHLIQSVLKQVLVQYQQALTATEMEAKVSALYPQAWECYQQHYAAINGRYSSVYPGVQQGLLALRGAGLRLACLTNKPQRFAEQLLRGKGLDGFFEHIFGGDAFARKKPDPLPLLKTCEALGTAPARTLMVGDSSNDAQAARAAGCPVALVSYGYNHGQPVQAVGADSVVRELRELVPQWVCRA